MTANNDETTNDIAIIGLSARLPKSKTIEEYWNNLSTAKVMTDRFSDQELREMGISEKLLNNPDYIKVKGIIEDIYCFDAKLFGCSPREAQIMDPQQRILLECCWEALENACYDPRGYQGLISVFVGASINTYFLFNLFPNILNKEEIPEETLIMLGNEKDFLATKISYKLDLRGASQTIQTACSTSLVAVHYACQSLLSYDSDIVLAGGSSITTPHKNGYIYRKEDINSANGECRPFDSQATGTVPGNGVGVIVLKRLQDAIRDNDQIRAIIKSSAINNDGATKLGFTAPSIEGQLKVISTAHSYANINPRDISYLETHGTGTTLGDPLEFKALHQAFELGTKDKQFCALGRVKANIGHLDAAAGIASLIKIIACLEQKQIPPEINFLNANPNINLEDSPFYINTELKNWKVDNCPRTAAVSSFGIGGTNIHMIIQETPSLKKMNEYQASYYLIPFSANDYASLQKLLQKILKYLKSENKHLLADIAYSLQIGRTPLTIRCCFIAFTVMDLVQQIESYLKINFDNSNHNSNTANLAYKTILLVNHNISYLDKVITDHPIPSILTKYFNNSMSIESIISNHKDQINFLKIFSYQYSYLKKLFDFGLEPSKIITVPESILVLCASLNLIDLNRTIQLFLTYNITYPNQKGCLYKNIRENLITTNTWQIFVSSPKGLITLDKFLADYSSETISPSPEDLSIDIVLESKPLAISLFGINSVEIYDPQNYSMEPSLSEPYNNKILKEFLTILSILWTHQVNIQWGRLYEDESNMPNRLPLPTYPFKKEYFYNTPIIDFPQVQENEGGESNVIVEDQEKEQDELKHAQNNQLIEEIQYFLLEIFKTVLNQPKTTIDDDFFAIGGDSLLALEIISQIEKAISIRLSLKDFVTNITIKLISNQLHSELLVRIEQLPEEQVKKLLNALSIKRKNCKAEQ